LISESVSTMGEFESMMVMGEFMMAIS
jgi:hypothetical protein